VSPESTSAAALIMVLGGHFAPGGSILSRR